VVVSKFDAELSRHLRPVAAPEGLWERIQENSRPEPAATLRWPLWAFAAALAATIALFCLSLRSDTTPYLTRLAARETAADSGTMDFRSSDPAQIRAWVQANAGFDIPLPAEGAVQLTGVKLIRGGKLAACVSYRIGDRSGRLLVAQGSSAAPQHPAVQRESTHGVSLASWSMGGQQFALAWPASQDLHGACVVCHVEGVERKPAPRG
jgi:hypothetical protein